MNIRTKQTNYFYHGRLRSPVKRY